MARRELRKAADGLSDFINDAVLDMWLNVQDEEGYQHLFDDTRTQLPLGNRASFVSTVVLRVIRDQGKARASALAQNWFRLVLSAEEREAIVLTMLREGIVDDYTYAALGSSVRDLFDCLRTGSTAAHRAELAGSIAESVIPVEGRERSKRHAQRWFASLVLLEEEKEAIVNELFDGGIRNEAFYRTLSQEALQYARRRALRDEEDLDDASLAPLFSGSGQGHLPQPISSRFDALFAQVGLATDLRDACLNVDELSRVTGSAHHMAPSWSALSRAIRHLRHSRHPEESKEFAHALARLAPMSAGATNGEQWRFPILRLLHLQQILEAPRLSKVVRDPAFALVPDVALYLMGRDDVLFHPELRVLRGSDRRWRARWVESAGEVVSTMFLEDSVQLDLSTLARMPEKNDALTPDFMGATTTGGKLVYESKGSSDWKTHLGQRKHALKQLRKEDGASTSPWATDGRTFACSLFAAQQGDERSSLLHVDDPPFQFDDQFGDGWESHCRREHAIAMLEAARLFGRADDAARQRRTESDSNREAIFRLPGGNGPEGESFVGTYLPVGEWARTLRHPNPRECERIRMFVGVQQALARQFERGEFPSTVLSLDSKNSPSPSGELDRGPRIGLLPGPESQGFARGMYSVLADGAFMAIEFE